jgi:hypothetical protein
MYENAGPGKMVGGIKMKPLLFLAERAGSYDPAAKRSAVAAL